MMRILQEKPDITGIAIGGMPPASPGMDVTGFENDPFDVLTFDDQGIVNIYASYPK